MKRWTLAVVTLISLTAGIGTSFAQGFGYGGGYQGYNSSHNNYNQNYNNGRGGQARGGHYDYHPAHVQRHGNHVDYVPGHYDYHQGAHRTNFFGW